MSYLHSKLLKTTVAGVTQVSTGRAYALLASDSGQFESMFVVGAPWHSILAVSVTGGFMVYDLGFFSALAGLGVLLGSMVLQYYLGATFEKVRNEGTRATDARVKLTGQVLLSMQSVKLCGWEAAFVEAIGKARQKEAGYIRKAHVLRALSLGTYISTIPLASFAAFTTRSALGIHGNLTFGTVSSIIAMLGVAKSFLYFLSLYATHMPEIHVACKRADAFLALPEIQIVDYDAEEKKKIHEDQLLLRLQNAAFSWQTSSSESQDDGDEAKKKKKDSSVKKELEMTAVTAVVREVSLEVKRGELVMVCGATGSGKSALLHACLRELDLTEGTLEVFTGGNDKGIAFSPQKPWNVSGSIRDNVTLSHEPVDEAAYRSALSVAALDKDCEVWVDKDNTIVGEKGLTLSGGQAARLALARCVYACGIGRCRLALLDDPLSAVDPKVADHLVADCIIDRLCRQLHCGVLLATHQRQFLDRADRVIVLDDDGRALANAPLADILQQGGQAADLIRISPQEDHHHHHHHQHHQEEKDDGRPTVELFEKEDAEEEDLQEAVGVMQVEEEEDREVGAVTAATWKAFLVGSGGYSVVILVLLAFVATETSMIYADVLLLRWSDRSRQRLSSDIYRRYAAFVAVVTLLGSVRGIGFFSRASGRRRRSPVALSRKFYTRHSPGSKRIPLEESSIASRRTSL